MRRVTRFGRPLLAAGSAPQCTCAPATLPIAARRALSTTSTLQSATRERIRKALWKDGEAPGPEDPYAAENSQLSRQEQIEADIIEANAQLAEFEKTVIPTRPREHRPRRPLRLRRPNSKLETSYPKTTAPTEQEVEDKKGYTPATDGDGLETIGGLDGWWEEKGRWGKEHQLPPPRRKIENKDLCEVFARVAITEALIVSRVDPASAAGRWNPLTLKAMRRAFAFGINVSEDGTGVVLGGEENQKSVPMKLHKRPEVFEPQVVVSPEEAKKLIKTWGDEWKRVSLRDPVVSFAFQKRFNQLTGHLSNDGKLMQLKTVGNFLEDITKPPKPANIKIAEAIQQEGSLPALPNVALHERRVTPIDKETALGRWKVITEELEKRKLPVTGHEHLPKPVQKKWILGKA
ncbi:hypothetical protein CKAH01_09368 [Colletotrichum kahawae]|uniref:Large ribosomal subunit protein mL50 n=1 Tax=Colletotrichum kahawae TaxID=34407 RepID=A0AAE0CZ56_COLKA|nr:hypothetical protein CKAH01_09368 [Colletotrichum kahawae]